MLAVGALAGAGRRRVDGRVGRVLFTGLKSLVFSLWESWKVLREGSHKTRSAFQKDHWVCRLDLSGRAGSSSWI